MSYISQTIEAGNKVTLVSTDVSKIDQFDSRYFSHILRPCQVSRPRSFIKRALYEWIETRKILKSLADLEVEAIILTIPSMFLLFMPLYLKRRSYI